MYFQVVFHIQNLYSNMAMRDFFCRRFSECNLYAGTQQRSWIFLLEKYFFFEVTLHLPKQLQNPFSLLSLFVRWAPNSQKSLRKSSIQRTFRGRVQIEILVKITYRPFKAIQKIVRMPPVCGNLNSGCLGSGSHPKYPFQRSSLSLCKRPSSLFLKKFLESSILRNVSECLQYREPSGVLGRITYLQTAF